MTNVVETTTTLLTIGILHPIIQIRARHHKKATKDPKTIIYPRERIRRGKAKPPNMDSRNRSQM